MIIGESYRGFKPHLEHGFIVWYRETIKHLVGHHPDNGKPIKIAKSGIKSTDMRVPTNTADYDEACKMLDNKLRKPKKSGTTFDPSQSKLFQ